MSNIPLARERLHLALECADPRAVRAAIRSALRHMHRKQPAFRATSRRISRIDNRMRQRIRSLRRKGWSIPDISVMLRLNSRSVSQIINGG